MKIFKYKLDIHETVVQLPINFKVLTAQYQSSSESFCVWVLVDPDAPKSPVKFCVLPTGAEVDRFQTYVSSTQISEAGEVWHIFMGQG